MHLRAGGLGAKLEAGCPNPTPSCGPCPVGKRGKEWDETFCFAAVFGSNSLLGCSHTGAQKATHILDVALDLPLTGMGIYGSTPSRSLAGQ